MCYMFFESRKDDETMRKIMQNLDIPIFTSYCYSSYQYQYEGQKNRNLYFGFYADPKIIQLIDEFNSAFKNIEIHVVYYEKMKYVAEQFFGNKKGTTRYSSFAKQNIPYEYEYIVFRIECKKGYTKSSRFVLGIVLAQFIRAYCTEYAHYPYMQDIEDNFIKNVIENYSLCREYGNWLGRTANTNLQTFMLMDNPPVVNKVTVGIDYDTMPYSSTFINKLSLKVKENVDVEDEIEEEEDDDDDW